jgi:amidase
MMDVAIEAVRTKMQSEAVRRARAHSVNRESSVELCFQSAAEIASRLRRRELSAVECLDYFKERVQQYNPALNAIVAFDWGRARATARIADQALAHGRQAPLLGVPMTLKESFDLAGLPTTWGDPAMRYVASRDDLIAERLHAAGAVIFGKTNVPFRLLDFQTYNDIYGTTNNPWDHSRGPGGSSGGAAAALAAGLTGLEVGSDIAGSIRNPSHYCGVFGHKPTYNLVGSDSMSPPPRVDASDLNVSGPLARSAEDLALAMRLLALPPRVDDAMRIRLDETRKPLDQYRVAIWACDAESRVQRQISDRCQATADRLARAGVKVSDTARPAFTSQHAGSLYRSLLNATTDPTNDLKYRDWVSLNDQRTQLRLQWQAFFRDWDIVLCPISATTAFAHEQGPYRGRKLRVDGGEVPYFQQLFWAGLATCSYLPSTVFPTGIGEDGLPIGLQAIGPAYRDFSTIEFARLVTSEEGFSPPPAYLNGIG